MSKKAIKRCNKTVLHRFLIKFKENHGGPQIGVQMQPIKNQRYSCLEMSSDRVSSVATKHLDSSILERDVLVLVTSATDRVVGVLESIAEMVLEFGMGRQELHEYYIY